MNFKKYWQGLKYWQKGALLGLIFSILLSIVFQTPNGDFVWGFLIPLCLIPFASWSGPGHPALCVGTAYIFPLVYVILGALIGLVIGKVKGR